MLLHLHHEVVQVDELGADSQAAERRLVQDLVEAVVVLDELGQSALHQEQEVLLHDTTNCLLHIYTDECVTINIFPKLFRNESRAGQYGENIIS